MGLAPSTLRVHGEFRKSIRHWDIQDVMVARMKYKLLTYRYCVSVDQLARILGRQVPDPLITLIFEIFAPKSIRVSPQVPVVDVTEVFVGLALVCQALMSERIAFIFDLVDVQGTGRLTQNELSILLCAVARSIVKMTSPPYAILPETVQKFALSGIALECERVSSLDKPTFCNWAMNNPTFNTYIRVCSGEDLPRLYIAKEKSNTFLGYVEFDSSTHMQSISIQGLRRLAHTQLSALPEDFVFLKQGHAIAKSQEGNAKAWSVIPFALLGTPGLKFKSKEIEFKTKASLLKNDNQNLPHPNNRPFLSFQFSHHHHVVETYPRRVSEIMPVSKRISFRLQGATTWWRPSQIWSGDWLINQSRIGARFLLKLKRFLKAKHKCHHYMIVKDLNGKILSNNPTLQSMQSKLRLLALENRIHADLKQPDGTLVMIVRSKKEKKKSYTRLAGLVQPDKKSDSQHGSTNVIESKGFEMDWEVIDGQAELPNSWSTITTSIPLRGDETQCFPVVWIRSLSEEATAFADVDISKKDGVPQTLLTAIVQTLVDKRVLNHRDVFGRTMLHHAVVYGQYRVVDVLLAEHALINLFDAQRNTALHDAASRGRLKEVSALLTNGALPTALNVHHQLPLLMALYCAERLKRKIKVNNILTRYTQIEQVIDLLWDRTPTEWWHVSDLYGISIYQLEQSIFGDIFESARAGLVQRIQHLLESKKVSSINCTMSILLRTPLHEACERGRYNACDFLVRQGADVFLQDYRGSAPVHIAARRGYDKIVEMLVYKFPKSCLLQDVNGKTALHLAIEGRKIATALHLIPLMSNVDLQDSFGFTPLHFACLIGNQTVVTALLEAGAKTNIDRYTRPTPQTKHSLGYYFKTLPGTTMTIESPLEFLLQGWANKISTSSREYFGVLELLLQKRSWNLNETDYCGVPLQHQLISRLASNPSVVVECLQVLSKYQLLLVNAIDQHGNTMILQECKRICRHKDPSLAVVRTLIDMGAILNLANEENELPLQCAAYYGNNPLVELLLDTTTTEMLSRDNSSLSPLHMACLGGHLSTIQLLLLRGSNLNDCASETPLCYGIRSGKHDVVQYLLQRGAEVNIWCPLSKKMSVFDTIYTTNASGVELGSPLTLVLNLASRTFQLPTYDIPPLKPELLAENQHNYLSKQEQKQREKWQNWYRIATSLSIKLLEIDSAKKIHVHAIDISNACRLGFWNIATQILTQRRISFPRISDDVEVKEAIHYAASAGQTAIVAALIATGVNPNVRVKHRQRQLFKKFSTVNNSAMASFGPLYFAISRGQLITAAKLYQLGATIDSMPTFRGNVALTGGWNTWMKLGYILKHNASSYCQHSNMIRQLEFAVRMQISLVHVACIRGSMELLEIYMAAGHSFYDVSTEGHTSLTFAIQNKQFGIARWICEKYPKVLQVKSHNLALPTACGLDTISQEKYDLVSYLLQQNLSISEAGSDGMTALDRAALAGDATLFDMLLEKRAYPTLRTVVAALQGYEIKLIDRIPHILANLEGATFDNLLKIFILAAARNHWNLVEHILTLSDASTDPIATWIRRAGSCCLILHRASAANQTNVVKLLLSRGVPADLVVAEIPNTRSPVWYAAIHGALESFLVLVLHLPPQQAFLYTLERSTPWKLNCLMLPSHSIDVTDVMRIPGVEICTWRNLSAFTCYQTTATQSLRIVHRCIQYWIAHLQIQPKNEDNQTLLHFVARQGDVNTAKAVVLAGAKLDLVNNQLETPPMLAAKRSDPIGTKLVQYFWPLLADDQKELVCTACTQYGSINIETLKFLLQETKHFKNVQYSPSLRSMSTQAIQLMLTAKIPVDPAAWQTLVLVLNDVKGKTCRSIVEIMLPAISLSFSVTLIAEIVGAASRFRWWAIAFHLLQMFQFPLLKQLNQSKETHQRSVLHHAVSSGEFQVIQYLLEHGWELIQDNIGQTVFHLIAKVGDMRLFQHISKIVDKSVLESVIDLQDVRKRTALHIAASRGHLDIVDALHSAGAKFEVRCIGGLTPSLVAAKYNQLHVVMRLVLLKPPPNTLVTTGGESITIIAAKSGAFRIVNWLILTLNLTPENVLGLTSTNGQNLVHYAALHNQLSILTGHSYLLQLVHAKDIFGCLPLHYALMNGNLEIVQHLCWNGTNVNGPIQSPLLTTETFDIGMLLSWSPLPGWFSHLLHGYHRDTHTQKKVPRVDIPFNIRSWGFPVVSLLEFAVSMGLVPIVSYIMGILRYMPQLCIGTLEVRQRIFMLAAAKNHVDVVDVLLSCDITQQIENPSDVGHTHEQFFGDFTDLAIQHSAHRGLEAMTLCLLSYWKGFGVSHATASEVPVVTQDEFASQFAGVLQHACIFGRIELIHHLIRRGGTAILSLRVDEGPALKYALAFGQIDAVRLIIQSSVEIDALDAYYAPSFKRWIEYEEPALQIEWNSHFHPQAKRKRPFHGPLESYDAIERLPTEIVSTIFKPPTK